MACVEEGASLEEHVMLGGGHESLGHGRISYSLFM